MTKHSGITVHKNHYVLIEAMNKLNLNYGRKDGFRFCEMSEIHLNRKIELCDTLIEIYQVFGMIREQGNHVF